MLDNENYYIPVYNIDFIVTYFDDFKYYYETKESPCDYIENIN
ncbi:MAG: hypothetical protein RR847_01725 [Bacilli bacterium]